MSCVFGFDIDLPECVAPGRVNLIFWVQSCELWVQPSPRLRCVKQVMIKMSLFMESINTRPLTTETKKLNRKFSSEGGTTARAL